MEYHGFGWGRDTHASINHTSIPKETHNTGRKRQIQDIPTQTLQPHTRNPKEREGRGRRHINCQKKTIKEIDKYILENNHENQCKLLAQAIRKASNLLLECDPRLSKVLAEYLNLSKALTLIMAHRLLGSGSFSIASKLLLLNPSSMRMGRPERVRAHERARKRVERIIKRYSKLLEFLEAYKPSACNPLDPLFRPKHDKTSGTNGQNISIGSEWPPRLGPTQRIILELLAYYDKNRSLIGNIIEDAETIYGVKLTYYQVAGALKRLLKRGLVQRIERGRYILVIPSNPLTPATHIHVENTELKSPYSKEPLTRTANDYYTLYELALEASKERANKVTRVELYIPLR